MLIELVSYFMLLFGSAEIESFYIISFDKGIKKYVETIPRRQDATAIVSVYESDFKEFTKNHKKLLQELQEKNADYNTTEQWYQDFFMTIMDDRKKLQAGYISGRLRLQEIIKQEEWDKIIELTSADAAKMIEKKEKKRDKKEGKYPYQKLMISIKENVPPGDKQARLIESLDNFIDKLRMIDESYENLYTNESDVLNNRHATKEEMQEIYNSLNELRQSLKDSYVETIFFLKDNTSENEWSVIVKDMNKL